MFLFNIKINDLLERAEQFGQVLIDIEYLRIDKRSFFFQVQKLPRRARRNRAINSSNITFCFDIEQLRRVHLCDALRNAVV